VLRDYDYRRRHRDLAMLKRPCSSARTARRNSPSNRERVNQGWTTTMINGVPHWIPPHWVDPGQRPRRNTYFDLPLGTEPSRA
jgi:hypothetical protein